MNATTLHNAGDASPISAPLRLCANLPNAKRRSRRGLSLVEVMVVIAIMLALAVILVPAVSSFMQLEQQRVARDLAVQYELLHDEAVLRNVTFRFAFHIDEGYYTIEVGSPETLIFDDPKERADFEEKREDSMKMLTAEEKAAAQANDQSDFAQLQTMFDTKITLPSGTKFGGVYTPQYGDLITPDGEGDNPDVVYSYIFPNGFSERAIIQLVEDGSDEEGFTLEVEPLSGIVHLYPEIKSVRDLEQDLPDVAPELSN
jgi:prepilin-type N-terminal cleavage/methylation domain-containing protein